jgi:hypothetical protein
MALTIKSIAAGTIKNTTATVIVNPDGGTPVATTKSTLIKNVLLTNNHGSQAVLEALYLRRYISSQATYQDFPITPKALAIPAQSQIVLDNEVTLANSANNVPANAADQIVIKFTTVDGTNGVSYVINGMERDL